MINRYYRVSRMKRFLLLLFAPVLLVAGCEEESSTPVIAQVGNATLTVEDLRRDIPEETLRTATRDDLQEYINQWVREELLYQAAEAMGYDEDQRVKERTREARRGIMVDVFLEDELDLRPFISDGEIADYYRNNVESFRRAEAEVQTEMLWFESGEAADEARAAIQNGMSFAEAAVDTSLDVMSADLEPQYLTQRELGDQLGDAVFSLRQGTLSRTMQIGNYYVLVRITDQQEAGTVRTLEQVRDEIIMRQTSDLWEMKLEELLQRLLDQSSVSINAQAGMEVLGGGG